jgi:hypothetical protein
MTPHSSNMTPPSSNMTSPPGSTFGNASTANGTSTGGSGLAPTNRRRLQRPSRPGNSSPNQTSQSANQTSDASTFRDGSLANGTASGNAPASGLQGGGGSVNPKNTSQSQTADAGTFGNGSLANGTSAQGSGSAGQQGGGLGSASGRRLKQLQNVAGPANTSGTMNQITSTRPSQKVAQGEAASSAQAQGELPGYDIHDRPYTGRGCSIQRC